MNLMLTNCITYDKVSPEEAELYIMLNQIVSPGLYFANFIFTGALSALGGVVF
jgi:hypothetical protein